MDQITYYFVLSSLLGISICQNPEVLTTYGKVRGFTENVPKLITKFMGIPFAKAPVGSLRFQKPQKPDTWTKTYDANQISDACFESDGLEYETLFAPPVNHSEDCLYLNIFIPGNLDIAKQNHKAVMFWIYGGGYMLGNANTYLGESISTSQDVIVVTFNYRIGLFGFLASEDGTFPGNVGLFDQHAALEWVNENIKEFGGDSSRITIFGESAGAHSVFIHLISPLSSSLFMRGIAQSVPTIKVDTKASQFAFAKQVVSLECPMPTASELLKCLQKLTPQKIRDFGNKLAEMQYNFITVDGELLTDDPDKLLAIGNFDASKDVMTGFLTDDGDLVIRLFFDWNRYIKNGFTVNEAKQFISMAAFGYLQTTYIPNKAIIENLLYQMYFSCSDNPLEIARKAMDLMTDFVFTNPSFKIVNAFSKYGAKAYLYEFDHLLNFLKEEMKPQVKLSAGHGNDIVFLFGYLDILALSGKHVLPSEKLLAKSFTKSFGEFAKTGSPMFLTHANQTVKWTNYNLTNKEYLKFDINMKPDSMQPVPKWLESRMNMWLSIIPGIHNMESCDPYVVDSEVLPPVSKGSTREHLNLFDILLAIPLYMFITTGMHKYF